jgi:hypothetical protein
VIENVDDPRAARRKHNRGVIIQRSRMKHLRSIVVAALLASSPSTTMAETDSPALVADDVVTLRDGTILRGHVTELKPGDHVEIVLLDGRNQTIQWSDIANSAGPSFPEVKHKRGEKFLQPTTGRAPIELESLRPVTIGVLQAQPTIGQDSITFDDGSNVSQLTTNYQSSSGVVVCSVTPCRIYARPGTLKLQVSGDNILSYAADLNVPPQGLHVVLYAPLAGERQRGRLLMMLGLPLAGCGAVMMALGAVDGYHSTTVPGGGTKTLYDNRPLYYGLGGALVGAGIAAGVAGIVLFTRNQLGVKSVQVLADGVHF